MISRPRPRIVALLATVLLLAAGCGTSGGTAGAGDPGASGVDGTASASTTPSGQPSGSPAAGALSYVALGDSYTAAPLVPQTDSQDPCLRSSNNYPSRVAAALPDYTLTDVSCAGADSAAMVGVQQIGSQLNPPQFTALTKDTDLVTVGLGGNDYGLFTSLLADCASSTDVGDAASPCTAAAKDGSAKDLKKLLPQVQGLLTAVIAGVKNRSPEATVVAVGYPRLLPKSGGCAKLPIAAGDYGYVRALTAGLNDAVEAAAAAGGATFIDVYAASAGHDICSADPWVNGKDTDPAAALAYHPFANEQQAVADLIVAALPA